MIQFVLALALLAQAPSVSITSPQAGAILQGQVQVLGSMGGPDFVSAELSFRYAAADEAAPPADTWFLIQAYSLPPTGDALAVWDTASITDGDYDLRLQAAFRDGSIQDAQVTDLRVRNDEPQPTPSPAAVELPATTAAAPTRLAAAVPPTAAILLPTSVPDNPASLEPPQVFAAVSRGALVALLLFIALAFLFGRRR